LDDADAITTIECSVAKRQFVNTRLYKMNVAAVFKILFRGVTTAADDARRHQATATFSALRRILDEASESLRVAPVQQVSPRRMDAEALRHLTPTIRRILPNWRDDEVALDAIRQLRRTYEPRLEGLAAYLLLPVPAWIDPAAVAAERFGCDAVVRQLTEGRPD